MADSFDWADACPWIDPPSWWRDGKRTVAGYRTWPEFLQAVWEAVKKRPATEKQRRDEAYWARAGRAFSIDRTAVLLEILMDDKAAMRFRIETEPSIWGNEGDSSLTG